MEPPSKANLKQIERLEEMIKTGGQTMFMASVKSKVSHSLCLSSTCLFIYLYIYSIIHLLVDNILAYICTYLLIYSSIGMGNVWHIYMSAKS